MEIGKLPFMTKPCTGCPFKKNTLEGWLGKERMEEILESDSFVCHKTAHGQNEQRRQCAGHMVIKGDENAFNKQAKALGISIDIKEKDSIFTTKEQCIKHHT